MASSGQCFYCMWFVHPWCECTVWRSSGCKAPLCLSCRPDKILCRSPLFSTVLFLWCTVAPCHFCCLNIGQAFLIDWLSRPGRKTPPGIALPQLHSDSPWLHTPPPLLHAQDSAPACLMFRIATAHFCLPLLFALWSFSALCFSPGLHFPGGISHRSQHILLGLLTVSSWKVFPGLYDDKHSPSWPPS